MLVTTILSIDVGGTVLVKEVLQLLESVFSAW